MAVIIAAAVLLIGIKFCSKSDFYSDNFSVAQTRALKGLCAIYVILHHLCTYLADYFPSFYAFKHIGFLMVGGFFMISGYGLMYGIKNKEGYLKDFFKKRILAILIPYYIINIFYLYANHISGGLTKSYIIQSIFGFNLWYVMAIIILYMGFYLSFKLFKKHGVAAISIFTFLYIAVMYILYTYFSYSALGYWWYNSVICFVLGIWYCCAKDKMDSFAQKHYWVYLLTAFVIMCFTYRYVCLHFNESELTLLITQIICSVAFGVFLLLLTMKIHIGNPILNICGDLSFELYLSHALFIFALRSNMNFFGTNIYVSNNFLYFLLIIAGSFIFSYIVHYISQRILKILK